MHAIDITDDHRTLSINQISAMENVKANLPEDALS
jgi:hypothetical protein